MLPLILGPGWPQGIARATPFRYVVNAMREAFRGHHVNAIMAEGDLWIGRDPGESDLTPSAG